MKRDIEFQIRYRDTLNEILAGRNKCFASDSFQKMDREFRLQFVQDSFQLANAIICLNYSIQYLQKYFRIIPISTTKTD